MNIPPKYEDVVANLDAALAREAALREELERAKSRYDREVLGLNNEGDPIGGDPAGGYKNDNARLQQRLAVAEQRAGELEALLREWRHGRGMTLKDCASLRDRTDVALKPAEEDDWDRSARAYHDGLAAEAEGSTCNQIREESGLPTKNPCAACNNGSCIDR